jgi:hypothetical protein
MIDDLYDDGLAATDATLLASGTEWFRLSPTLQAIGGGLVTVGILVFGANLLLVIRDHSPHPLGRVLLGSLDPRQRSTAARDSPVEE